MFVFQLPLLKNTDYGLKNVFLGKLNGTPPPSKGAGGHVRKWGEKFETPCSSLGWA